ncbi:putative glucuronosyltransferase GUT1 [Hordeum vulgare]|nr:putative glucuronosyltransferase GUT1 [Hordeum vulgare]
MEVGERAAFYLDYHRYEIMVYYRFAGRDDDGPLTPDYDLDAARRNVELEFDIQEEEEVAMILALHIKKKPKHGGSIMGRQKIWRDKIYADNRLMRHYFVDNLVYPESYFRRRFRICTEFFKRIAEKLASHDRFFQQRWNVTGEIRHGTFQNMTVTLRMLAYGIPADLIDDHLPMAESQAIMYVKHFAVGIVQVFGPEYLRAPNVEDVTRLLEINQAHWFHNAEDGQKKGSTIILEALFISHHS